MLKLIRKIYFMLNAKKIKAVFDDLLFDFEIEEEKNKKTGIVDFIPFIKAKKELINIIKRGELEHRYNQLIKGSI